MSTEGPDRAPRRRYLLTPPGDTRPSLLVELCPKVDDAVLAQVREAMFGLGCGNGLVLDAQECVILHDTFRSTGPDSIELEPTRLETPRLLGVSGEPIEQRLERWLHGLATNWHGTVPRDAWATALLTDVVPAASGSLVRRAMM